mmetsp:Transcript_93464/g.150878  ORF Transcript_93464/g.150878 Transcript_93464/m.150878 type:complete len:246 (-) Transcript_93464:292-1029(-)
MLGRAVPRERQRGNGVFHVGHLLCLMSQHPAHLVGRFSARLALGLLLCNLGFEARVHQLVLHDSVGERLAQTVILGRSPLSAQLLYLVSESMHRAHLGLQHLVQVLHLRLELAGLVLALALLHHVGHIFHHVGHSRLVTRGGFFHTETIAEIALPFEARTRGRLPNIKAPLRLPVSLGTVGVTFHGSLQVIGALTQFTRVRPTNLYIRRVAHGLDVLAPQGLDKIPRLVALGRSRPRQSVRKANL